MIKLVAVDMDGTFLHSDKTYNRDWFKELRQQMTFDGVKFVVASGNQYYQLRSFFDDWQSIPFVAENGGLVLDGEEELFVGNIPPEVIEKTLKILAEYQVATLLCGRKKAYYTTDNQQLVDYIAEYYYRMEKVQQFWPLPADRFLKFANIVKNPEHAAELTKVLNDKLAGEMIPVNSGHQDIDIILPGVNKAHGLKLLGEKYQILPNEMIAFGDAGNDLEMLKFVEHGFAMANGQEAIKAIAQKVVPSNNEDGVLQTIQDFVDNKWEYPYA